MILATTNFTLQCLQNKSYYLNFPSPPVQAYDLLGTEDEELASLPGSLQGLLLTVARGQEEQEEQGEEDNKLFVIKQTKENLCGTIAVIHVLANK